jgi:hypothetical protein
MTPKYDFDVLLDEKYLEKFNMNAFPTIGLLPQRENFVCKSRC